MKKIWVKACIHHRKHYENEEECGGGGLSKKEIEEIVEICESDPIDWGWQGLVDYLYLIKKRIKKNKDSIFAFFMLSELAGLIWS